MSFTTRAGAGLALLAALVAGCGTAASHSAAPKPTRMPHSQHTSPPTEAAADPPRIRRPLWRTIAAIITTMPRRCRSWSPHRHLRRPWHPP